MNSFMSYFLQTAIAISIFYILYWLLLRKETFFRFNRYYFLLSVIISLILPFLNLGGLFDFNKSTPDQTISGAYVYLQDAVIRGSVITHNEIIERHGFMDYLTGIYFTGLAFLLFRLFFESVLLLIRIRKARIVEIFGSHVVLDKKVNSPFSFFFWIFLNPKQIKDQNISDIILHEKEHIRQKHSFDLFLIELMSAFQWINPFVWLLRKSIKETHEYLADLAVLKQGVPVDNYQKLLLSYALGTGHPALITPLNFSLNKKRMIMMTKIKSPNARKWRSLLLLPVILILGMAFSNPFSGEKIMSESESNDLQSATDSAASFRIVTDEFYIQDAKELSTDKHVHVYEVTGTVLNDETGKPMSDVNITYMSQSSLSVETSSDSKGEFLFKLESSRQSDKESIQVAFSFVGFETVIVDAKNGDNLRISLKKDVNGASLLASKGLSGDQGLLDSTNPRKKMPFVNLYILDGKEISYERFKILASESIKSIEILEGKEAVKRYGQKAQNGVFIITLKDKSIDYYASDSEKSRKKIPSVDLYILDGKEISIDRLKTLDPGSIRSIEVLKGEKAVKIYGEKAQNGAVLLTTKEILTGSIAQKYEVGGKVLNAETGKPMPGVNIVILHTTIGTVSDVDGRFLLQIDKETVQLAFSFVGFETQILDVKNGDKLEVKLKKGVTTINLESEPAHGEVESKETGGSSEINTNDEIFFVVEDMPHFPGGMEALNKYVSSHVKYPRKAVKNKKEGKVFVNFTVDESGNVVNVYVDKSKSLDPDLDKEAIRVISGMPKWEPAKQRGKAVPVELSVPVKFTL